MIGTARPAHPGSLLWIAALRGCRARHARLRDVLAGHHVRSGAAPHPGRRARRQRPSSPRSATAGSSRATAPTASRPTANAARGELSDLTPRRALQRHHPRALPPAALPRRAAGRDRGRRGRQSALRRPRAHHASLADGRLVEARPASTGDCCAICGRVRRRAAGDGEGQPAARPAADDREHAERSRLRHPPDPDEVRGAAPDRAAGRADAHESRRDRRRPARLPDPRRGSSTATRSSTWTRPPRARSRAR